MQNTHINAQVHYCRFSSSPYKQITWHSEKLLLKFKEKAPLSFVTFTGSDYKISPKITCTGILTVLPKHSYRIYTPVYKQSYLGGTPKHSYKIYTPSYKPSIYVNHI